MIAQARIVLTEESETEARARFAADVIAGLTREQKAIAPKYFYDAEGSRLFEAITRLPEYYPTRTEIGILKDNVGAITRLFPPAAALVEFGSGSSVKTRILLRSETRIAAYVPVDISGDFLEQEAARLRRELPHLAVLPVAADFTRPFDLPRDVRAMSRIGFFPGSTIGNFEPDAARRFLENAREVLGAGALMIVGADLRKDPAVLEAAYDDAAGVTARFNRNLLVRINRELGANFDVGAFGHRALYDEQAGRIEMHLVSLRDQQVTIRGRLFRFRQGETIHTENSHKFTVPAFVALARSAGWASMAVWTDAERLFSVHALKAEGHRL